MILAFDTSAAHCAAALLAGDRLVAARSEELGRGQAERLMALLEEVLAEGGAAWSELDALGVGVGPGNFTGIRISVAAARGLALGLGIPAVGVSMFEALALELEGPVYAAVKGPADKTYVQWRDGATAGPPALCAPGDRVEGAADRLVAFPGAAALNWGADLQEETPLHPLAEAIARVAAQRWQDAGLARPAPLYVKPPDAAPARDAAPRILT